MQVEAERQRAEKALKVIQEATWNALRVIHDGGAIDFDSRLPDLARMYQITATEPVNHGWGWTVDVTVDHITFRYTRPDYGEIRFELLAECPDCGEDVLFGYRINSLAALGIALDEQAKNPKGMHRCAEDEDDDGEPVGVAVDFSVADMDPAHVLLDALQGYIHAAVRGEQARATKEDAF